MKLINKVAVPVEILKETSDALRIYGHQECEGLVLWLGNIYDDNTCRVEKALVPPQDSIQSEDGVGYFVSSETLFALNKLLSSTGLRLLAQVHSHPGLAYHSGTDDRYCIVTEEGGFSIVVPDFGFGPSDISKWATFRLIKGDWKKLSLTDAKIIFEVKNEQNEAGSSSGDFLLKLKDFFH